MPAAPSSFDPHGIPPTSGLQPPPQGHRHDAEVTASPSSRRPLQHPVLQLGGVAGAGYRVCSRPARPGTRAGRGHRAATADAARAACRGGRAGDRAGARHHGHRPAAGDRPAKRACGAGLAQFQHRQRQRGALQPARRHRVGVEPHLQRRPQPDPGQAQRQRAGAADQPERHPVRPRRAGERGRAGGVGAEHQQRPVHEQEPDRRRQQHTGFPGRLRGRPRGAQRPGGHNRPGARRRAGGRGWC